MLYTILLQDIKLVLNLKYMLVEILLLIKHYHIIFYIISQNYLYNMGIIWVYVSIYIPIVNSDSFTRVFIY